MCSQPVRPLQSQGGLEERRAPLAAPLAQALDQQLERVVLVRDPRQDLGPDGAQELGREVNTIAWPGSNSEASSATTAT